MVLQNNYINCIFLVSFLYTSIKTRLICFKDEIISIFEIYRTYLNMSMCICIWTGKMCFKVLIKYDEANWLCVMNWLYFENVTFLSQIDIKFFDYEIPEIIKAVWLKITSKDNTIRSKRLATVVSGL